MARKAVVIGAGLSGASSAILLAQRGWRVTLLEKSAKVLPTVRGFSKKGMRFDTGFHYAGALGPGGCLRAYLEHLGVMKRLSPLPLNRDGFDRVLIQEPELDFRYCAGARDLAQRLEGAFPGESPAIAAYLGMIQDTCAATPLLNLDLPPGELRDILALGNRSLGAYLDGLTRDPLLKAVLSVHCLLYGSPPGQAPLHVHAYVAGSLLNGVCTLKGGGSSLAEAFELALAEAGVEVACGREVAGLAPTPSGRMGAVRLADGEALEADACVCSTHPAELARLASPGMLRPAYVKRMASLRDTPSAHMLFLALEADSDMLKGHNLLVLPGRDVEALFEPKGAMPHRGLFAAATQDGEPRTAGLVALADHGPWRNLERGSPAYEKRKREMTAETEKAFMNALPEAAGRCRVVDGATPLTIRKWLNQPTGALYGTMHRMDQYNPLPLTRCEGLYVAGQAVISPGLLGAVVSAYISCGLILGWESLGSEVRKKA